MTMPPAYNVSSEEDVRSFPASFAQQWLWSLDQSEPNTLTYNLTSAVRICIPLDLKALEQSLYAGRRYQDQRRRDHLRQAG